LVLVRLVFLALHLLLCLSYFVAVVFEDVIRSVLVSCLGNLVTFKHFWLFFVAGDCCGGVCGKDFHS
jgi:hypothetical protein